MNPKRTDQDPAKAMRDSLSADPSASSLERLRAGVLEGLAQADAGDFADGTAEEVVARAFDHARTNRNASVPLPFPFPPR